MGGVFTRETRPSREGAHPAHALLSREQSRADLLRDKREPSNEKGHERVATSHHEIQSEAAERSPRIFDALREDTSFSRNIELDNVWSPLHEEAVRHGEKKLKNYQQEFIRCRDKDVDSTLYAFEDSFETTIMKDPLEMGRFNVLSTAYEGGASYSNSINIQSGEILGIKNSNYLLRGQRWSFSEVIFNQFQLVMQKAQKDIATFDLKNWRGKDVSNKATKSTVELFLPEKPDKHTFEKGSLGFIALAGTPTAQSKFYLLAQHQKAFGKKEVTSITVERRSNGEVHTNYRFA